jgi:hypothetical protein
MDQDDDVSLIMNLVIRIPCLMEDTSWELCPDFTTWKSFHKSWKLMGGLFLSPPLHALPNLLAPSGLTS